MDDQKNENQIRENPYHDEELIVAFLSHVIYRVKNDGGKSRENQPPFS